MNLYEIHKMANFMSGPYNSISGSISKGTVVPMLKSDALTNLGVYGGMGVGGLAGILLAEAAKNSKGDRSDPRRQALDSVITPIMGFGGALAGGHAAGRKGRQLGFNWGGIPHSDKSLTSYRNHQLLGALGGGIPGAIIGTGIGSVLGGVLDDGNYGSGAAAGALGGFGLGAIGGKTIGKLMAIKKLKGL